MTDGGPDAGGRQVGLREPDRLGDLAWKRGMVFIGDARRFAFRAFQNQRGHLGSGMRVSGQEHDLVAAQAGGALDGLARGVHRPGAVQAFDIAGHHGGLGPVFLQHQRLAVQVVMDAGAQPDGEPAAHRHAHRRGDFHGPAPQSQIAGPERWGR